MGRSILIQISLEFLCYKDHFTWELIEGSNYDENIYYSFRNILNDTPMIHVCLSPPSVSIKCILWFK